MAVTPTLDSEAIGKMLIESAKRTSQSEQAIEEMRWLHEYSPVQEVTGLYRHNEEPNTFIFRTLPDWEEEEGETYETWVQDTLIWIGEELGTQLTQLEELRVSRFWALYRLT